ncbi:beta-ketoacyl-ACP synthase III [Algiphilus sp.]|uniref:beta-ketoacyl-ACP synthase III n=1 Tax=Algiphilus sp. TaxID=1872431 RepID=UPI0025C54536|nr:beta-ketoacyl-ACP synthase III [Algiphilus sp.]MCK5770427.1 ketoacyl-ACP synthase III [Algiphilus sp.]
MSYARIRGTGSYLPERVVTNTELEGRIDTSDEWIVSRTGIEARHVAADDELTSDLALHAARAALEAAGREAGEVDLIIVATTTPDMVFPSTACIVQHKLGAGEAAAFDVQAVCTGFIYALSVAERMVATGAHRCALVVGAEVFSRLLDWNDRRTCVLFGDGAGAVVISRDDEPGLLASHLGADGSQGHILRVTGGIAEGVVRGNPFIEMDGQAVFRLAVRALGESAERVLTEAGLAADAIDWFIPHQANLRIIRALADRIGLPFERVVTTVAHHGNTSAASVPLALDTAVRDGRVRTGQTLLLQGVGGGMTWGSLLLRY